MNIIKKFIIVLALSAVPLALFGPANVSAGPFSSSKGEACRGANLGGGGSCSDNTAANSIGETLTKVINILTIIVGIAAVVVIIINGLKFITSNGDSNSISSAKNGIIYALVGLIIVALSQAIVRFIINRIY